MNFLAHLFLDSSSDDALLGSLLGDFVKGDTEGRFNAAVSDAILLHRKIDSFADAHVITRKSRIVLAPCVVALRESLSMFVTTTF